MKALVLKEDFEKQLNATNGEISSLLTQVKSLETKREQLKGAVFALETLVKLEVEVKELEQKQMSVSDAGTDLKKKLK